MLIDVNTERSIDIVTSHKDKGYVSSDERDVYIGSNQESAKDMASIHIGTLDHYTGRGPGDYMLTSIKQMTGTDNFLAWPYEKRKCAIEKYENCQMRRFLEGTKSCGCSPFQLLSATEFTYQVHP